MNRLEEKASELMAYVDHMAYTDDLVLFKSPTILDSFEFFSISRRKANGNFSYRVGYVDFSGTSNYLDVSKDAVTNAIAI
ncbi:MAG: hypothetical protein NDI94_06575, partial [Candidatus Woesearchaeota archaeon]|nr:hypothetical protein [Candidatus Woesearchaeota archaeon]